MKIVAGLGNPGIKYERSRHNVGFEVVDQVALTNNAGPWKNNFDSMASECAINGEKVVLLKPQTYMNRSGGAVRKALDFYKLDPDSILVVCDDFNLELGRLRFRANGSAGGQNGVKDVIAALGTEAFARLRVGIDPPPPEWDPADYVLSSFRPAERQKMDETIIDAGRAVELWCREGIAAASNQFNQRKSKE
jgi:PTH1 family peptidyl-tRNA hydrolase